MNQIPLLLCAQLHRRPPLLTSMVLALEGQSGTWKNMQFTYPLKQVHKLPSRSEPCPAVAMLSLPAECLFRLFISWSSLISLGSLLLYKSLGTRPWRRKTFYELYRRSICFNKGFSSEMSKTIFVGSKPNPRI